MAQRYTIVVLGGGGHAGVLIDCMQAAGECLPFAVLDADAALTGQEIYGVPIVGDDSMLPELIEGGVDAFVVGLGSVGKGNRRKKLFDLGVRSGLHPVVVKHPRAFCSVQAVIGPGTALLPGCIVNTGVRLGVNGIVNSGAIVEHDCVVGDHVHIATGAKLAGGVSVGNGAHIGIGAVVRQGIHIGEDAVVGAGAVVVKDIDSGDVVAGNPARVLK